MNPVGVNGAFGVLVVWIVVVDNNSGRVSVRRAVAMEPEKWQELVTLILAKVNSILSNNM